MKYFAVVNDGLEQTAKLEIEEKLEVEAVVNKNVLEFETKKQLSMQSIRRLLIAVDKTKELSRLNLGNFPKNSFKEGIGFKILVEGVKGQENRFKIAAETAKTIYDHITTKPKIELKKPDLLVVVFYNGESYFIGIDEKVSELDARPYRVFPHSASFKGDLAYYFVRKSGHKPGEKFLSGFCKDGAIAIEAAKYSMEKVYAFDQSMPNVTAARKNSKIAKADIEVKKYSLEDLELKYGPDFFDTIIFHLTTKDENQINELYYQIDYILKKGGKLLVISRPSLELSFSDKFGLLEESNIQKGGEVHKVWLFQKIRCA
ncbi:MAG TPA: methyltransferase domain-containing protein [Candidatus Nanoarchaeia archaeon]|nr:methyltransferase domain-containing protein [Candidatus Nanoarchaeia archaeon]